MGVVASPKWVMRPSRVLASRLAAPLAGAGAVEPARPVAGDLAARSAGPRGARAGPLWLQLVKHKSALKNRVHSTLINFAKPCPVTDLFGVEGRALLARLQVPEPWRGNITASVELIDDLERQIAQINRKLRARHAEHPYIPLLMSAPGIGWVLAFTIAAEIGEIERFPSPRSWPAIRVCVRASISQATRIAAAR